MTTQRVIALDGLRGLAILLVLGHNFDPESHGSELLARLLTYPLDVGWAGVQLFFVLSGYLITSGLLAGQASPHFYRSFFIRRTLRIFPLYFVTLFLLLVVLPWFVSLPPDMAHEKQHQIWLWLYLSNWTAPLGLGGEGLPHFWSLAVEEQFYILWPFIVHRRRPAEVFWISIGVIVASLLARTGSLLAGLDPKIVYSWTIYRMDALAVGSLLAALLAMPEMKARLGGRFGRGALIAAFIGAAMGTVATRGFPRLTFSTQTVGYTLLAVVFGLLVLAAVLARDNDNVWWLRALRSRSLGAFGKYSYGMYVIHKPLHDLVGVPTLQRLVGSGRLGLAASALYIIGATVVTLVAAIVSYHLLERHFLALKERFSVRLAA